MFEAESEPFRQAGVRIGSDEKDAEQALLEESLAPFPLALRNEALRMALLYAIIYCFENSVRDLIRTQMSEKAQDWWPSASVPRKVREMAESRLQDAEKNSWLEGVNKDILGFV